MRNILAGIADQSGAGSRRRGTHRMFACRAIWCVAVASLWKALDKYSLPVKAFGRSRVALQLALCFGKGFRKFAVLTLKTFLLLFQPANLVLQECDMLFLDDSTAMLDNKLLQLSKDGDIHTPKLRPHKPAFKILPASPSVRSGTSMLCIVARSRCRSDSEVSRVFTKMSAINVCASPNCERSTVISAIVLRTNFSLFINGVRMWSTLIIQP